MRRHDIPTHRITPDVVTSLLPHQRFVFGSNLQGIHGAAKQRFGAVEGVCEGPTGQCYAIPTKLTPWQRLTVSTIGDAVDNFTTHAEANPHLHFLVTAVGCGLAGYTPQDIAGLFHDCIDLDNVSLPLCFWDLYCATCHSVIDLGYCACDEENSC